MSFTINFHFTSYLHAWDKFHAKFVACILGFNPAITGIMIGQRPNSDTRFVSSLSHFTWRPQTITVPRMAVQIYRINPHSITQNSGKSGRSRGGGAAALASSFSSSSMSDISGSEDTGKSGKSNAGTTGKGTESTP